jgi:hypothetical protein
VDDFATINGLLGLPQSNKFDIFGKIDRRADFYRPENLAVAARQDIASRDPNSCERASAVAPPSHVVAKLWFLEQNSDDY